MKKQKKNIATDSPVRRRSQIFNSSIVLTRCDTNRNDDEAERAALIAEDKTNASNHIGTPKRASSITSIRTSTGDITSSPHKEHFQGCLKLFAENKINKENAWSLQLIDFMTTMLKRHDKRMENLQIASTTLDASAKIYSFRVDAVHHDVLKVAGGLSKASQAKRGKRDDDQEGDIPDEGQDGAPAAPTQKKKRRARGSIATSEEQLNGDFDVNESIDPFFARLAASTADMTSSNRAFNATLPVDDHNLSLVLRTDQKFLPVINEAECDDLKVETVDKISLSFPEFKDTYEICAPFTAFCITNWNPDDEKQEIEPKDINGWMDDRLNLSQQAVAFDMNAEVEPIPNDDYDRGMDDEVPVGLDSDEEDDMVLNICAAKRTLQGIVQLTDGRPTRATDMQLEYSYSSALLNAWAGPCHWKLKNNINRGSKSTEGLQNYLGTSARSTMDVMRKVAAPKKKRQLDFLGEGLSFHRSAYPNEYSAGIPSKITISRKTLVQSNTWNDKNFITPIDRGLDDLHFRRFYLKKNVLMLLPRRSDIGLNEEKEQNVSDIRDYDYNNDNDTSYCPNNEPDNEDHQWLGDDAALAGDVHSNMKPAADGIGDMVEPPNKVAKVYIPYAMRAKKVNMKQLKLSTWKWLTSDHTSEKENEPVNSAAKPQIQQTTFCNLYNQLPTKLSTTLKENISVSLTLLAVLHLANEKGLVLKQDTNDEDFTIVGLLKQ